jgi:hypothetical protein
MIRSFDEMELRETEFEKASALDSSEFENIRNEFFKKTVVHPLIGIIIAAAVASLWFTGVIQKLYVISDVITIALMFLVAFCIAMSAYLTVQCIMSLFIYFRINKKDFYWHEGRITRKKLLWTVKYLRMDHYYLVDDEYCSRVAINPRYRTGTEVYFLYIPGFWESSCIGGFVVRKR